MSAKRTSAIIHYSFFIIHFDRVLDSKMVTHETITIDGRETRVKKPGAGEIVPIVSKKMIFGIN